MEKHISRRDLLKLSISLPLYIAAPRFIKSVGTQLTKQNVVILVLDALSANNISLFGYPRETMPQLARWSERAVVYHNHYAGGNYTTPGTASFLTGVLPWKHRAFDLYETVDGYFLEKNIFTAFPNHYRIAYTHNPVANTLLNQFSKKMDEYVPLENLLLTNDNVITTTFKKDESTSTLSWTRTIKNKEDGYAYSLFLSHIYKQIRERSISDLRSQFPGGIPHVAGDNYFLLEDAIDWLSNTLKNLPQPFIGYFHFMPPHGPYNTHKEFFGRFDGDGYYPPQKPLDLFSKESNDSIEQILRRRANYDEFVLYADREFGKFMDKLDSDGLLESTWVILTSDHGEMFERGIVGHLTNVLYEPVIRVPLIIFDPGRKERIDVYSNSNAVDLLPTLLHGSGQAPAGWSDGVVLPPFAPEAEQDRGIFVIQSRKNPKYAPLTTATIALLKEKYKLIYYFGYPELGAKSEHIELYDLKNDPEELNDLSLSKQETTSSMLNELMVKLKEANAPYQ